ncbi:MAG: hypothetical protein QMB52_03135 [Propionivibrio sp.]
MRAQHERRTGKDRRQFDLASLAPRDIERRREQDQRSNALDETAIYKTAVAEREDDYWERLRSIPSENFH